MRAYEFITEARVAKEYSPRDIEDVKWAYDQGNSYDEISRMTGIDRMDVNNILGRYYPERQRRKEHLKSALTDDDKAAIVYAFMDGAEIRTVADDIGIAPSLVKLVLYDALGEEEVKNELDRRRTVPGARIRNKVTSDMIPVMRAGYEAGKSPHEIADDLGKVVGYATVLRTLRSQPDWTELRAKWEAHRREVRHSGPTTTKIYRPGTIGNLQHKGPGSKHMARKGM